jgi:hypothetical protein
MSTLKETTLIMKRLSSAYGQGVDVERARAYHQVLGQYQRMVLAEASTIALTQGSQFLPKPVELLAIIQRNNLVARWAGADKTDERTWWLEFVKGYASTDEFTQEDVDAIYSGIKGYEPYKAGVSKAVNRDSEFLKLYRQIKTQGA